MGPNSRAILWARALFAFLAPAKAEKPSPPLMLAVAPVNIIVPLFLLIIFLATSRPIKNAPNVAISHTLKYFFEEVSVKLYLILAPML